MLWDAYIVLFLVFMLAGTIIAGTNLSNSNGTVEDDIRTFESSPDATRVGDLIALHKAISLSYAAFTAPTAMEAAATTSPTSGPISADLSRLPESSSLRGQLKIMHEKVKHQTSKLATKFVKEGTYNVNTADKLVYQLRNLEPLTHAMGQPQWNPTPFSGNSGINFVIGISSVGREKDYVVNTLTSVLGAMSAEEKSHVRIVLMNGNVPPSSHTAIKAVEREFHEHIKSGLLSIITNPDPVKGHPQLIDTSKLTLRWQDAMDRVVWRSKQVLDVAVLLEHCSKIATPESYFLMIEDDVIAAMNFVTKIRTFVDEKLSTRTDWATASFYNPWTVSDLEELPPYKFFGVIGQVFRPHDLPTIVEFLRLNFDQSPLDWLFVDFLKKFDEKIVVHTPSMFQHVGEVSSLGGKSQPSRAVDFEDDLK